MQQSILNKIQGGLAGMYISQQVSLVMVDRDSPESDELRQRERETFKNYALLVGASMESLIHCKGLDLDDWLVTTNRLSNPDRLPIAIVPIAMYLQEDLPLLQKTLRLIGRRNDLDPENVSTLVFFGTMIALLLAERTTPDQLIPDVLATLPSPKDALSKQLTLIQEYMVPNSDGSPSPTSITELIAKIALSNQSYLLPTAMATYCFLSTPHSLQMAVQRAAQIPGQPSLTLALTGVLVGTYRGLSCIPTSWYANGSKGAEQLIQSADRLVATWAGAYQPIVGAFSRANAIAATGVIQNSRS
jgi:ADP-ribosylglycohydrolase